MARRDKGQSPDLGAKNYRDPTGWRLWHLSLALKEIAESPVPDAENEEPPGQGCDQAALTGGREGGNAHEL